VTIGLIAASALIIVRVADPEWTGFAITAATVALVYATGFRHWQRSPGAALLEFVGFA